MDGIDIAIWFSASTVTTVGYGDRYPITRIGRIFALIWMFSGVLFLGLLAGAVASSMSAASAVRELSSVSQLSRTTSMVCTHVAFYGKQYLDPLSIPWYEGANLQGCMDDLLSEKATAVMYETIGLRYQMKLRPEMTQKYYIVAGVSEILLGPAFSSSSVSDGIYGAVNAALTEFKEENFYLDLMQKYFPVVRDDSRNSAEDLDWYLTGPAVVLIVAYAVMCIVSSNRKECCKYFRKGNAGYCKCCQCWQTCSSMVGNRTKKEVELTGNKSGEEQKEARVSIQLQEVTNPLDRGHRRTIMSQKIPPHHLSSSKVAGSSSKVAGSSNDTHSLPGLKKLLNEHAQNMDMDTMMSSIASIIDVAKMQQRKVKEDKDV